jgi:DNA-binding transcriptional LysR family regulator
MDRFRQLEVFRAVMAEGSFSDAARRLGMTPQAVSRSIASLEQRLQVALFQRTTREMVPTRRAREFLVTVGPTLARLEDAERSLRDASGAATGTVRISVPTGYGHRRFLPALPAFLEAHPGIDVDVEVANHNVDFVRDGFDLAIRMGALADTSFVARRLGLFPLGVYASPAYLSRRGTPRAAEDLADHDVAAFVMPRTARVQPWSFANPTEVWHPRPRVRVRYDVMGLVSFACSGAGLVQTYDFLVEDELARGVLVEVLPDRRGTGRPFSLVYAAPAVERPVVRILVDWLVAQRVADHDTGFRELGTQA